jgi:muramoyltetrapeptide carboxypeptidase
MRQDLIRPTRLSAGGTIGLISPADSADVFDSEIWQIGERRMSAKGYRIQVGQFVFTRWAHSTAPPRDRAHDLMSMVLDPAVDVVMAVLGGFNSHQLLPYLDYQVIRENPKPIIGFSDITALTNGIYAKTGVVTFVGPVFGTFCQPDLPPYTEQAFEKIIVKGKDRVTLIASDRWADDAWHLKPGYGPRNWHPNPGWTTFCAGRACGPAVGGNLPSLLVLAGTPYMPSFEGAILMLEEDETATPAVFDRGLTQLRHMGVFDRISGLVFGRFPSAVHFGSQQAFTDILENALEGTSFPVVAGADFSHTDPLMTIPLGVATELDTAAAHITFLEAAVV